MKRSTGAKNKQGGMVTNLTINPSFTVDTTGWTAANSTLGVVSGKLEITGVGGINPAKAWQDIITEVGRLYQLSVSFQKGTGVSGSFKIGTTTVEDENYTSKTLTDVILTKHEIGFIASETTTRITLISNSIVVGETSLFDEVRCQNILDGFGDIFRNCRINLYQAPQVSDPDLAAPDSDKLLQISNGANGLTWESSVFGLVNKSLTESWQGIATKAGLLSWFRIFEENDDPTTDSTLNARIDGTIGIESSDLNMPTLFVIVGTKKILVNFAYKQQDL